MTGQVIILNSNWNRVQAKRLIDLAPHGAINETREAKRSNAQNDLMWALIGQVARQKPDGRHLSPDVWKALFMHEADFKCTFEPSLDGSGFVPLGFKSSRLNKVEFSTVIEAIYKYAGDHSLALSDKPDSSQYMKG